MNLHGITISKSTLILNRDHRSLLNQQNLGVSEMQDKYILHSASSSDTNVCHLKGLLQRIRSDEIYNSYNDDFGLYNISNGKRVTIIMKK